MGTISVNLPDHLRSFVEAQVAERKLADAGEYVSTLIAADRAHAHLEALLLEGLNSGPAREMTRTDWEELHAEIARRFPGEPAEGAA